MSDRDTDTSLQDEAAVAALLKRAAPRPLPPADRVQRVRESVRADWQAVTAKRRRTLGFRRMAIAASVILAAFVGLNALQTSGVAPVSVATIDRQVGLVRIVGDNSNVVDGSELTELMAGQVLTTGQEAGVSLSWLPGGTLRIDAGTRIEFVSATEVRLHSGRIYYDSAPALQSRSAQDQAPLIIATEFGRVTHVGTRYMTRVDRDGVTVSVRDGLVRTTSPAGVETEAGSREQLRLARGGAVTKVNVRPFGKSWDWIEKVSPVVSLDGRSVLEFLGWVNQETGLAVSFESDDAETYARVETLNGQLDAVPRQALEIWMLATDLDWRIDEETGVIHVRLQ